VAREDENKARDADRILGLERQAALADERGQAAERNHEIQLEREKTQLEREKTELEREKTQQAHELSHQIALRQKEEMKEQGGGVVDVTDDDDEAATEQTLTKFNESEHRVSRSLSARRGVRIFAVDSVMPWAGCWSTFLLPFLTLCSSFLSS